MDWSSFPLASTTASPVKRSYDPVLASLALSVCVISRHVSPALLEPTATPTVSLLISIEELGERDASVLEGVATRIRLFGA